VKYLCIRKLLLTLKLNHPDSGSIKHKDILGGKAWVASSLAPELIFCAF